MIFTSIEFGPARPLPYRTAELTTLAVELDG